VTVNHGTRGGLLFLIQNSRNQGDRAVLSRRRGVANHDLIGSVPAQRKRTVS